MLIALVFGLLLLVGGGVAAWFGTRSGRRSAAIARTETIRCADVKDLLGAGPEALAECKGRADAESPLTAPFSGQTCVWYRSTVSHLFWDWTYRDGERVRERKKRTVSEQLSETPLTLTDDSGSVLVDPGDAKVDRPRKVFDEFEKEGSSIPFSVDIGSMRLDSNNSIGFQREEWIIAPGDQLYVLGGVSDRTGAVAISKPQTDRGELLISTGSEEQILGSTNRLKLGLYAGAVVGIVGGLALLVLAAALA